MRSAPAGGSPQNEPAQPRAPGADLCSVPCLGVIVPCYNEAATLDTLLARVLARPETAEVVVVDDGSTDASSAKLEAWAARDPRVRVLRHDANRGKGAAIQTALPHLRSPFVVIQDADLEYDPDDYPNLLRPLLEGRADAVYGTRWGTGAYTKTPFWHRWGNRLLSWLARKITGLPITDEATGYKAFRRELLVRLELRESGFGFCPEVTAKLARLGARVVEVPIRYQGRTRAEGKKIRWHDGWGAVRCLLKYSRMRLPGDGSCAVARTVSAESNAEKPPDSASRVFRFIWLSAAGLYGLGLVWAVGLVSGWGRWYSASPYYRQQAAAFLRGDLALSRDPADLSHDLCWSEGGVHQVWGLGVPLWRLPFELGARVAGFETFPDMLALAVALALTAWWVFTTLEELGRHLRSVPTSQVEGSTIPMRAGAGEPERPRTGTDGRHGVQGPHAPGVKGHGAIWILMGTSAAVLLLFPPWLNLLTTRFLVWEEAVAYEYLAGIGMIAALIRVVVRPGAGRFALLGSLAGLGMLVRPTLVFHGAAALLAAMAGLWLCRRTGGEGPDTGSTAAALTPARSVCLLGPGVGIYLLCGALLYMTNLLRFGGGFEFGHKLNLQVMMGSVYVTRFDHPFASVSPAEAAAELCGLLFCKKRFNGWFWYEPNLFAGQSDTPRWREVASTTYDFFYLALILAGWAAGLFAAVGLTRRDPASPPGARSPDPPHTLSDDRGQPGSAAEGPAVPETERPGPAALSSHVPVRANEAGTGPGHRITFEEAPPGANREVWRRVPIVLGVYSFFGTAALSLFYLRNCVIATRYMLDYMPAFAAAILAAWWGWIYLLQRWRKTQTALHLSAATILVWLGIDFMKSTHAYGDPQVLTWSECVTAMQRQKAEKVKLPLAGVYESPDEPAQTGLSHNGAGWNPDGTVLPTVILFVHSPLFIELELAPFEWARIEPDPSQLRAKIGLEFLKLEKVEPTAEGWRVRFAGPRQKRYQEGLQPLFLAMVPREFVAETRDLPWRLLRVRWREGP
ncbi:glycosyltransferase family 2 protein [Limisphaera sp. 4302-co]|uniref:glycosyltransferase family 2 protein n=1 Tax=Limisphaera sp. 4302-co TaxID=3400417 RepID=UPI003C2D6778